MRVAANEYRAKAFECLSQAECMNDPVERAEILRFARMWMELAEPIEESQGAYEVPPGRSLISLWPRHWLRWASPQHPGPPARSQPAAHYPFPSLDLLGELKLYGMKAAYDEIMAAPSNASTSPGASVAIAKKRGLRDAVKVNG
jgi:hypothetical protein